PGAGRIENAALAWIDVRTFNQSIVATSFAGDSGADARVDNAGIFRKSTGGGYAINVPFLNTSSGLVDVQAGSFVFNAGGSHRGAVALADATGLTLGGGTHDVHTGASFSGPGTLTLAGTPTVLNLVAPTTVDSAFAMSGGTIKGADLTLTGPAAIAISSALGVMSGPGTTTLKAASGVSGGVNNPFGLDSGRVLRNESTMTVTGVLDLNRLDATGSGRIVNAAGAVIDVRTFNQSIIARDRSSTNPLDTGADARIDNAGIFRKSTPGGYGVSVHFNNTGTVEVLAGRLVFASFSNAGTVRVADDASFEISGQSFVNEGRIEGVGSVFAPAAGLVNAGLISPGSSPGRLRIEGDLQMESTSVVEIELGGLSLGDFDVLEIAGAATLGGELSIARLAGYTPALGDSFVVMMIEGGRTGEFAVESFHGFGAGVVFAVTYNDHEVTLGVTAVPEPATWVMILAGVGLVVGIAQRRRRASGRLPD
ncbi:MAG: PEP-CTERM sorting domain-containing protein, partial [Burkholderiales bacterium]